MPQEGADRFKMAYGGRAPERRAADPGCHFLYEVLSYHMKMSGQFGKLVIVSLRFYFMPVVRVSVVGSVFP